MYKVMPPKSEYAKNAGAKGIFFRCYKCLFLENNTLIIKDTKSIENDVAIILLEDLEKSIKNYAFPGCGELGIGSRVDEI